MTSHARTPLTCPVCGATAHPQDRLCPACGGDLVETGDRPSLLDELLPLGADPERHPGVSPASARAAERDRRGAVGSRAPLLLLVAVVALGALVWWLIPRGDGAAVDAVAPAVTATAPATGTAAPSPLAPSPAPSASGVPSAPGEPTGIRMAAGAASCGDAGGGVQAWRGNDVTSCAFALETASALAASHPSLPATVTARSPVTKKEYTMACDNTVPVMCTGGNDALVYVDLPAT